MNYISNILFDNSYKIYNSLDDKNKDFINEIINLINEDLKKYDDCLFKKYNELEINKDYFITEQKIIDFDPILKKKYLTPDIILNKQININLIFNEDVIKIFIYCNDTHSPDILFRNINKIITRLYNLLILFSNKKYSIFGEDKTAKQFKFNFFLFNNPRIANKNMSGKDYLEILNKNKIFNSISGETDIFMNMDVECSRFEEVLGLLTHEFMHAINLIFIYPSKICNINIDLHFTEMYVNSFATIFHSYLISREIKLQKNGTELTLHDILLYEIIHTMNQLIRLERITSITLTDILNRTNMIDWYQNGRLYEYIIGRVLVLFNYNLLKYNYSELLDNFLDQENGFNTDNKFYVLLAESFVNKIHEINKINNNNKILDFYNNIISLNLLDTCTSCKLENNDLCGHMIMQYFLFDPIEIQENKKLLNLYGGDYYKNKYLKYKAKYLNLKNKSL